MVDRPPLPGTEVLDRLEAAEVSLGEMSAWRVLVLRRGQERATAQDFTKENILGARWNVPEVAAVYTALERETAGAEGAFLSSTQGTTVRFQIGLLRISLERVVDLRDPNDLDAVGLSRSDVEDDRHDACRLVGSACAWLGMSGLLVPSARRWPETNLVIYPGNFVADEYLEPAGEPAEWEGA